MSMKKGLILFAALQCVLSSGCTTEMIEPVTESGGIIGRAYNVDISTGSISRGDDKGPIVFTGNDILWFNETTKEIRFKNNMSIKPSVYKYQAISFYIDEEYMFSTAVCVSGSSSQVYNSLVFFYNVTENKYYLLEGYLPAPNNPSDIFNGAPEQQRDGYKGNITSEWNKFIDRLKNEGKYNK